MIICELTFNDPDSKNPDYSFMEVDYYAFVPYSSQQKYGIENHRLTLRKNLKLNQFEVYRFYHQNEKEEIAFSGSFKDALKFADKEWNKYWGHIGKKEPDIPCKHKYPNMSYLCPYRRK